MAISNIRRNTGPAINVGPRAQESALEQELAPGFSTLPGGNLMYQVATDYPKQMANIMAEYEARAKDPRYNPFGESPDSPRRLEQELIDPFRAVFAASQPAVRTAPPRYFETGGDIVEIGPGGKARTVFDTPARDVGGDKKRQVESSLLVDEIKTLGAQKLKSMVERAGGPSDADIDAEIAKKKILLEELFNPTQPAVLAAPAPTPRITIGAANTQPQVLSTNAAAPPVTKWVVGPNGVLMKSQ